MRGGHLTIAECPAAAQPLMREFVVVGVEAARLEEEDTTSAIAQTQMCRPVP